MRIGMALSGGGIRATVFHLGVLARFAVTNQLEDISFISTVSGGSLCIGLVFATNNNTWPSSSTFCSHSLPEIRSLLINHSLERRLWIRTLTTPKYVLRRQAKCLASLLQEMWGITGNVNNLPEYPRWVINATCHETGKRWRFERKRMGDYLFGETAFPTLPVSQAIAASAGVPMAVGSLIVDTKKYEWVRYDAKGEKHPIKPDYDQVHLWDGAIYDNLGVEAFAKRNDVCDFLVISDASAALKPKKWSLLMRYKQLYDITSNQAQSLRSRMFVDNFIKDNAKGSYLKIGGSMEYIFRNTESHNEVPGLSSKYLSHEDVQHAKEFGLTLRRLRDTEFDILFRHGYEVADCTLYAYSGNQFPLITFNGWSK